MIQLLDRKKKILLFYVKRNKNRIVEKYIVDDPNDVARRRIYITDVLKQVLLTTNYLYEVMSSEKNTRSFSVA
jgi:hypothetical protein